MPSLWDRLALAAKAFKLGSAVVDPTWSGFGKSQDDFAPEVYGSYAATSVSVYACVNLRSTALSALPLKLYKGQGDARKEVTAGPMVELLQRVNPYWTMSQLLEMTEQSLALWGQAFWILERGTTGKQPPKEIWWARPDRMKLVPHPTDYIGGYIYEGRAGEKVPYTADEVIWFRLPNAMDEFAGLSPIAAARLSIELGRDGLKANHNLFRQGMQGVNIISPANPDITWGKEKVEGISQMLSKRATGEKNAHRSLVMGHQLKSEPLGISPADAQFIEQMRWSLADVCRVYGVAPLLVQDLEKATYSNFEQALQAFWTLTMVPQANRIAATITERLLPMFPGAAEEAAFDLSGVSALQEKEDSKWVREQGQLAAGAITINEWRKGRGLPEVAWGSAWWAPMGVSPVENADQPEPPAPVMPPEAPPAESAEKALRLIASLKAWEFNGDQHAAKMKAFDDQAEGHEDDWAAMCRKLFEDQEAAILADMDDSAKAVTKRRGGNPFDKSEWEARFADEAIDPLKVIVTDAGGKVYGELGIGGRFNVASPSTTKFIRQRAQRFAESVNRTTWDRLKTSLADGEKAGETIDQLKERVKTVMRGRIKSDAETIARTEVIGGLNGGALQAAKDSGVVKAKKWLAAIDNRTRDTHIETHGEEVPLDADFSLGGPAPGQIGDAGEDINCRCTLTFVVDDGKRIRPGAIAGLKAFVANGTH
jgi:HK97 family phage portal protein